MDVENQFVPLPMIDSKEFQQIIDLIRAKKSPFTAAAVYNLSQYGLQKHLMPVQVLAQSAIVNYLQTFDAYVSEIGDVVVFLEESDSELIKTATTVIQDLLVENTANTEDKSKVCDVYTLPKESAKFEKHIARVLAEELSYFSPTGPEKWIRTSPTRPKDLSLIKLRELEDKVAKANLSKYVRSQAICAIEKGKDLERVSREIFISVQDVQEKLVPGINLYTNPYLFRYLTQSFDQVALNYLMTTDAPSSFDRLNLNLNISTLYSDTFLAFLDQVNPEDLPTITIEVQKADVFTDLGAFLYIKNSLQQKGIRVCMDALNINSIRYINLKELALDYIKLYWSPSIDVDFDKKLLKDTNTEIILAHCESEESVKWGQKMGIKYFQGWHVDTLLMPGFSPANGTKK